MRLRLRTVHVVRRRRAASVGGLLVVGLLLATSCSSDNEAATSTTNTRQAAIDTVIEGGDESKALDPPPNVEVTVGRIYSANGDLDVYRSTDPGPHPIVVVFPGRNSDKRLYSTFGARLASAGAVVLVPNYRARVSPQAALEDAHCVIDAAADRAAELGGDPNRLIVVGFSAGAITAMGEGLSGSWQAAPDGENCGAPAGTARVAGVVGVAGQYGFYETLEKDSDDYRTFSAFAQATATPGPKVRLIVGTPDQLPMTKAETDTYADALRAGGHDVTVTAVDQPNLSLGGLYYDDATSSVRLIEDVDALGPVDTVAAEVLAVLD